MKTLNTSELDAVCGSGIAYDLGQAVGNLMKWWSEGVGTAYSRC